MHQENKKTGYAPIENYGIIGNLNTVALVSLQASIDFMCFPRFDSPTLFCKLLDVETGGCFCIKPVMKNMVSKQLYLPETNILLTRFFSEQGITEVIDFMPVNTDERDCAVVRKITTIRGKIEYSVLCAPRFDYARASHKVKIEEDGCEFFPGDHQPSVKLFSDAELEVNDNDVTASFTLKEGESHYFVLKAMQENAPHHIDAKAFTEQFYQKTIQYWHEWIQQCSYDGNWREMVHRSALTLKLLISQKYGSMVAAPTFSLPEAIGQSRNWDYRYTWIRDAAFSMHAFLQLGFLNEAEAFLQWLKERSTNNELQLMFSIDGKRQLDESFLENLEGYKNSLPVRIGNDAHKQSQMDIYGELLETIYIYTEHGGDITYGYWKIIEGYIELVINHWMDADHSIWEIRGIKREFLFSRFMCWVAIDRAIKIADRFSFPFDMIKWHEIRDTIYKDVYENFWSDKKQAFVQYKGSTNLDASSLLMPLLNIISPQSDKWKKTMTAIDKELRSDVLIYRYREQEDEDEVDGLKGKEGTFSMCSFWYVECLALAGEIEKAKEHFEKMLGYANHLGLFSEEIGMRGEHLGNFPQAFTHLALISAAIELSEQAKGQGKKMPLHENKMR
ncbi:MAG TPA: glycoside hydrolase family 15 protein [Chitinophagaceae bacterium]